MVVVVVEVDVVVIVIVISSSCRSRVAVCVRESTTCDVPTVEKSSLPSSTEMYVVVDAAAVVCSTRIVTMREGFFVVGWWVVRSDKHSSGNFLFLSLAFFLLLF